MSVGVNHVGHCVQDLERSVRFYCDALGFKVVLELDVPDEGSAPLLSLNPPLGLRAVYLVHGPFVLELLGFRAAPGPARVRDRVMNESGLTHLSIGVEDVGAAAARAAAY